MAPPARMNGRALAVGAVALLLLLPLAVVELPPLLDYPNHLARAAFLAGLLPEAAFAYAPHWQLLPNLTFDLMVPTLMQVLPAHLAGRAFVALALLLPLAGALAYHAAAFGGRSLWPLGIGLVAYGGVFLLGFLNFSAGLGLSLLGAAAWIRWGATRPLRAALLVAALGGAAFLTHVFAAAFLFLLAGCHEAGRLVTAPARARREAFGTFLRNALILTAAAAPVGLLLFASPLAGELGEPVWLPPAQRLRRALIGFAGYHQWADLLVAGTVGAIVVLLVLSGRARLHPGSVIAAILCLLLFAVSPVAMAGGSHFHVDLRFPTVAAMLVFVGLEPLPRSRAEGGALGAAVAGLLVLRVGLVGLAWVGFRADLAALREVLADLPREARLATVQVEPAANLAYFREQRARRIVSFANIRPDDHLGALAMLERGAVWPGLFTVPGQQPLRRLPPYADFRELPWYVLPNRGILLGRAIDQGATPDVVLDAWAAWPRRFDHVLVLNSRAAGDAATFLPDRLELLRDGGFAALYRVRRP
jgi:hypothetical protein